MYFLIGGIVLLNVYFITSKLYKYYMNVDTDDYNISGYDDESTEDDDESTEDDNDDKSTEDDNDETSENENSEEVKARHNIINELKELKKQLVAEHDNCFKYNIIEDLDDVLNKTNIVINKLESGDTVDYTEDGEVMTTIKQSFNIFMKLYMINNEENKETFKELLNKVKISENKSCDSSTCNECVYVENKYGQTTPAIYNVLSPKKCTPVESMCDKESIKEKDV
jgi:hypothetical protein